MPNVNMFVPPDMQEQQQEIDRRRQYAQLLQQQAKPQEGQMVSGHYVPPSALSYVNQILGGALAGHQTRQADSKAKALAEQLSGRQKEWMGQMPQATTETVDMVGPTEDGSALTSTQTKQPTAQDFTKWAMQGMNVDPQLAKIGFGMADRADDQAFKSDTLKASQQSRMEELRIRSEDARLSQQERQAAAEAARKAEQDFRERMLREQRQHSSDLARISASNRVAPAPNLVQVAGEDGNPVFMDARNAVGKTPYSKPASPVTTPAATKAADANEALSLVADARKVLKEDPTGSYLGMARDMLGQVFGKSTKGAQGAAQLKAIEGILVSKMPKMSGPQSDKDVALYRQMAASIGDPSIPSEQKKKALDTLEEIQKRYVGGGASAPSKPAGRNIVVDF